jgi:hypothetical protein
MIRLDPEVIDTVRVQFSFSNWRLVPPGIFRMEDEIQEESDTRKQYNAGDLRIDHVQLCFIGDLLDDLEAAKYTLVFAGCKSRIDRNDPEPDSARKKRYPMVRFMYAHNVAVANTDEHAFNRRALRSLADTVIWRVRAYSNPVPDSKKRVASIHMEVVTPLYAPEGGRRYEHRRIVRPLHTLGICNGTLQCVPVA